MGGGKKKTVYRTQSVPNDYDDAWIREKFGQMDQQALGFANWQAGRQASLGREERIRDELQSGLSGLSSQQAAAMAEQQSIQQAPAVADAIQKLSGGVDETSILNNQLGE